MTAHLQSAARAFEAVMRDLRPEHHWIGEVRPGQLDERAGNQHQTKPDAPAVSPDERLREAATDT